MRLDSGITIAVVNIRVGGLLRRVRDTAASTVAAELSYCRKSKT